MSKRILLIVVAVLLVVSGVFTWYYLWGPCGKKVVEKSDEKLMEITDEWGEALRLAGSTSRINLSGPVQNLQSIRKETRDIEVPNCLEKAKEHLVTSMDYTIDGFLLFMSQESDPLISTKLDIGDIYLERFIDEMIEVRECVPFCQ